DGAAQRQEREQPGAQQEPRGGARGGAGHADRASLVAKRPCGRTSSTAVSSTSTASGAAAAEAYPVTRVTSTPTARPATSAPTGESSPPTTAAANALTNSTSAACGSRPSPVGTRSRAASAAVALDSIQPRVTMRGTRTPSRR